MVVILALGVIVVVIFALGMVMIVSILIRRFYDFVVFEKAPALFLRRGLGTGREAQCCNKADRSDTSCHPGFLRLRLDITYHRHKPARNRAFPDARRKAGV